MDWYSPLLIGLRDFIFQATIIVVGASVALRWDTIGDFIHRLLPVRYIAFVDMPELSAPDFSLLPTYLYIGPSHLPKRKGQQGSNILIASKPLRTHYQRMYYRTGHKWWTRQRFIDEVLAGILLSDNVMRNRILPHEDCAPNILARKRSGTFSF